MTDGESNGQNVFLWPYPHIVAALDQYHRLSAPFQEVKSVKTVQVIPPVSPNKKMRILITTFWDYPFMGGLQNYIATLKAGLENLGHHVDVVAPNHFSSDEIDVIRPQIMSYLKKFYRSRYGSYSEKIIKNECSLYIFEWMLRKLNLDQYDIFHAQDRFTANVLSRLNQTYKKPFLFTPHGFMTQNKLKFNLIKKESIEEAYYSSIDRQSVSSAHYVIALCEVFHPLLKKLGADEEFMSTVYSGIDFESKKRSKQAKERIIITCVSRLRPRKGHKYLFEALALLRNELEGVEVRIVGDGVMREELENQVRELQLGNVYFLGSRSDIPELLSESDIFILPTTSDTLPLSIIEAMFAGQAILTTNCGGIPEIIHDTHSGLIAEPANVQQLADKLLLLLRNRTLRKRLAAKAKGFAEKHLTVASMAQKIEEIYQSLH